MTGGLSTSPGPRGTPSATAPGSLDFALPEALEARQPPEARGLRRDGVRLMVSRRGTGEITHHTFHDLPALLSPGDLLVVNNSATLPAAVRLDRLAVHFSGRLPSGEWLVELRRRTATATEPYSGAAPGEWLPLPGGATLRLAGQVTPRMWRAVLDRDVPEYLAEHGVPIRYGYVPRDWPISAYQTVFGVEPGSAEMPSAGRPFTARLVAELVSRGIAIAPVTLHTGVASPEKDEPPYPEWFSVPASTARLVNLTRAGGGRVVAVGTTVVRALETAALDAPRPSDGDEPAGAVGTGGASGADDASGVGGAVVRAASGWTSHIVTPEVGVRAVDGLITGLHEPRSTHLMMLSAVGGPGLVALSYQVALDEGYLWHEFGDAHLIV
ncbi:S-adenosylmethionine:tRNA ribosyltransferase-isomerase [Microbispora sp. ATCC PTA-5024]|uniref:S-adenosylmethionine:tRNA ribosyltransferase-isomerase n=1 Tax=Microbispora sp. ATCC PTA-5024 TaxID=316330 RepID=UPI0003DCF937|nr:S-adenosylmethionine:tRNA ribosyltransferase-isomerase [Microbispora sp. ATCC PTA-5024]ETK34444.1 S-adenosylmethionine tRNA ribosyltransferase [Microbispora sp. ATCC PTA-5024]